MAVDEPEEREPGDGGPTAEDPKADAAERRRREVLDILLKLLRGPRPGGS